MSPWSPWRKRMDGKASSATDATWSASLVRRKSPFTVVDKYHGRGLGTALLRHLAVIARQGGLRELVAYVLPDNKAMLTVFEKSGLKYTVKREAGSIYVKLGLTCNRSWSNRPGFCGTPNERAGDNTPAFLFWPPVLFNYGSKHEKDDYPGVPQSNHVSGITPGPGLD